MHMLYMMTFLLVTLTVYNCQTDSSTDIYTGSSDPTLYTTESINSNGSTSDVTTASGQVGMNTTMATTDLTSKPSNSTTANGTTTFVSSSATTTGSSTSSTTTTSSTSIERSSLSLISALLFGLAIPSYLNIINIIQHHIAT